MYDYLDKTLENLVRRDLPDLIGKQVDISFNPPDSGFEASVSRLTVNFFLYDVRENRELRDNEPWIERKSDRKAEVKPPPKRIDCSYLITAWQKSGGQKQTEDEHHLLGQVTRVLLRYPTLPKEVWAAGLETEELPLPTTALLPGRLQSLGEFWQALGGKPKAALNYQVTLAIQPFAADTVPVVLEKQLRQRQLEEGERP